MRGPRRAMKSFDNYDSVLDGYDDTPDPVNPVSDIPEQVQQESGSMSMVEKRLELAKYYRLLMDGSLFNDDSDEAREVEDEIRGFVQQRLETLVGLRAPTALATGQFSSEEVAVLKAVAAKVLKKPSIVVPQPPVQKREPTLKTFSRKDKPEPALNTVTPPKRKPGRPRKLPVPTPEQENQAIVDDMVRKESKPEVIKEGESIRKTVDGKRKFKRIIAPDGKPFDIEVTEQAVAKAVPPTPMPSLNQLEMLSRQQAETTVTTFLNQDAAIAAMSVINKNGANNGE